MGLVDGVARAALVRAEMKRDMRATLGADDLGGILDQFKRRARSPLELEDLANALGFSFSRYESLGLVDPALPLYRDGRRKEVENVVHGLVAGTPLALFDYEAGLRGGAERHFTCAQLGLPGAAPSFAVEDGAVECEDRRFADALMDDETAALIEAGPAHLRYEAGGHWALVASSPLRLEKWEMHGRTAILWGARVAGVLARRSRVV